MVRLKRVLPFCVTLVLAAPIPAIARIGTVPLDRTSWFWSSIPTQDTYEFSDPSSSPYQHADLEWYNPRGVKERDLNPTLLDSEGGDNEHQVLELRVKQAAIDTIGIFDSSWTGITQSISRVGLDLTRFHYLEIWLNDFMPYPNHDVEGILYIDLGRVSEDAFWDPRNPPNGILDTEDKNGDGTLDRSDNLTMDEDTGLDGLHSVNEPGYFGGGSDPNGDDYYFDPERVPLDYSGINNMEGNGVGEQTARPDTEDLHRDGFADFYNAYFQAFLNLASDRFLEADVTRDYGPIEDTLEHPLHPLNGWRRYRLPLTGEAFTQVGPAASWENVQHIRLWIKGMTEPIMLQIGGIELLDALGRPVPREPVAHQNAPNPFNPGTTIRFELPDPGRVRLRIYDVRGRLVRQLLDADYPAGYHGVSWNGEDDGGRRAASGAYWYRVELPGVAPQTRKMVLAR